MNFNVLAVTLLNAAFLFSCAKASAENRERSVVIGKDKIKLEMDDLKIGETQTFEGKDGTPIEVTRNEQGLVIVKSGKTIEIANEGGGVTIREGERLVELSDHLDGLEVRDDELKKIKIDIDMDGEELTGHNMYKIEKETSDGKKIKVFKTIKSGEKPQYIIIKEKIEKTKEGNEE